MLLKNIYQLENGGYFLTGIDLFFFFFFNEGNAKNFYSFSETILCRLSRAIFSRKACFMSVNIGARRERGVRTVSNFEISRTTICRSIVRLVRVIFRRAVKPDEICRSSYKRQMCLTKLMAA